MLTVTNLTKQYGASPVLNNISITLKTKETVCLVGPSGCGKTTLLRAVAGLEAIQSGEILLDGRTVSTPRAYALPHQRQLSMIFQDLALWPHMRVFAHLDYVLKKMKLSKKARCKRIHEVLESVNIDSLQKRYPHELSGGEKQRLALARAIAPEPRYLLMDEPMSSLDPVLKSELFQVIERLKTVFGLSILYVTHNVDEVVALADTVIVMQNGIITHSGSTADIMKNGNPFFRAWLTIIQGVELCR